MVGVKEPSLLVMHHEEFFASSGPNHAPRGKPADHDIDGIPMFSRRGEQSVVVSTKLKEVSREGRSRVQHAEVCPVLQASPVASR